MHSPTMCISLSFQLVLISMPGMTSITPWAVLRASLIPATVSWSVRANALSSAFTAARTSSAGVKVPSEAVECTCKSTLFIKKSP